MNLNHCRCIVACCDHNAHYDKIRPWMKIVYESNQSTWIKLINYFFIKSLKVSYIYICCHKQIVWWLIDKVSCCVCCWCTFYLNSCAMWRESVLVWGKRKCRQKLILLLRLLNRGAASQFPWPDRNNNNFNRIFPRTDKMSIHIIFTRNEWTLHDASISKYLRYTPELNAIC